MAIIMNNRKIRKEKEEIIGECYERSFYMISLFCSTLVL